MQIQQIHFHSAHPQELANRQVEGNSSAGSASAGHSTAGAGRPERANDGDIVRSTLDRLRTMPESRMDRVAEAKARLANGEFNSHEAAQQTAASILDRT